MRKEEKTDETKKCTKWKSFNGNLMRVRAVLWKFIFILLYSVSTVMCVWMKFLTGDEKQITLCE